VWLIGLLTLFSVVMTTASAEAGRVALLIGNAAYKETAALANPRNDANDLADVLKRLNFEVMVGFDLSKREMERLIRQFDQKLVGAEIALFFYAGHGIQVGGKNHLIPIDARLSAEGDIDFESLPLELVTRRMEREAKTSIIILDACRDNPLAKNLARTMGTRSTDIGAGLAEVRTGVGTLISFSTQPGNVALDGTGRNSPFTSALLRQIEVKGRDIMTTLAAVRGDVLSATRGKQVPWEHTSLLGPVILSGPAIDTASPIAPPVAKPMAGSATDAGTNCNAVVAFLKETGAFGSRPVMETAYADRVAYYKRGNLSRSEVLYIARDYERRYPTRIYEIDEKTLAIRANTENACIARFEYNFSAKNNSEERSGRGWAEYTLQRRTGRFEVTTEVGDVLTSNTGRAPR
jgi:hypothetical protein